ncbi:hypothetical protein JKP88DRAFT_251590 [Tribonema minus]|uniref:Uncharacterized protein n=1 Tax=Tribonema minus TaxID=303371 RepID=A0A836CMX1_9STRA|nr:hypothetical protein JKP88DRAFT_251590 [Tribonema minus]
MPVEGPQCMHCGVFNFYPQAAQAFTAPQMYPVQSAHQQMWNGYPMAPTYMMPAISVPDMHPTQIQIDYSCTGPVVYHHDQHMTPFDVPPPPVQPQQYEHCVVQQPFTTPQLAYMQVPPRQQQSASMQTPHLQQQLARVRTPRCEQRQRPPATNRQQPPAKTRTPPREQRQQHPAKTQTLLRQQPPAPSQAPPRQQPPTPTQTREQPPAKTQTPPRPQPTQTPPREQRQQPPAPSHTPPRQQPQTPTQTPPREQCQQPPARTQTPARQQPPTKTQTPPSEQRQQPPAKPQAPPRQQPPAPTQTPNRQPPPHPLQSTGREASSPNPRPLAREIGQHQLSHTAPPQQHVTEAQEPHQQQIPGNAATPQRLQQTPTREQPRPEQQDSNEDTGVNTAPLPDAIVTNIKVRAPGARASKTSRTSKHKKSKPQIFDDEEDVVLQAAIEQARQETAIKDIAGERAIITLAYVCAVTPAKVTSALHDSLPEIQPLMANMKFQEAVDGLTIASVLMLALSRPSWLDLKVSRIKKLDATARTLYEPLHALVHKVICTADVLLVAVFTMHLAWSSTNSPEVAQFVCDKVYDMSCAETHILNHDDLIDTIGAKYITSVGSGAADMSETRVSAVVDLMISLRFGKVISLKLGTDIRNAPIDRLKPIVRAIDAGMCESQCLKFAKAMLNIDKRRR